MRGIPESCLRHQFTLYNRHADPDTGAVSLYRTVFGLAEVSGRVRNGVFLESARSFLAAALTGGEKTHTLRLWIDPEASMATENGGSGANGANTASDASGGGNGANAASDASGDGSGSGGSSGGGHVSPIRKRYLEQRFWRSAPDKSGIWTLQEGDYLAAGLCPVMVPPGMQADVAGSGAFIIRGIAPVYRKDGVLHHWECELA